MKRVLLTGAGGFMGSHILRHLLINTDWDLVLIDSFRHRGKTDRISQQLEGQDSRRVTVITHDLTAPVSDQMKARIGDIDYILNVASESHVDRSIEDPRTFIENNVQLMLTMLEYARTIEFSKFIQISTDEVYGPAPDNHDHAEGEPHRPSNPYSASKAAQEDICYAYWRTYDMPICITNTMNIIGEMQDPEKYIPMTIKKVLAGETVQIHASPDGKRFGSRYYLHARNQADALMFILNGVQINRYSEWKEISHYHVVGEREVDNLELAQLVAKFVGKPLKYEAKDFHSSRPGHDLRYGLDGARLFTLGWRAPLPFEDSLKATVEWTLAHPEWLR
jgi:dTDP-glucose 4,6-dehydratase